MKHLFVLSILLSACASRQLPADAACKLAALTSSLPSDYRDISVRDAEELAKSLHACEAQVTSDAGS